MFSHFYHPQRQVFLCAMVTKHAGANNPANTIEGVTAGNPNYTDHPKGEVQLHLQTRCLIGTGGDSILLVM